MTEFSFEITDNDCIEQNVEKGYEVIDSKNLKTDVFAYFWGMHRETVPVQINYDKVAVHAKVSKPELWEISEAS